MSVGDAIYKCPICGEFYSALSQHVCKTERAVYSASPDPDAEIAKLKSLVRDLVEDGERLKGSISRSGNRCSLCGRQDHIGHAPDCPITLHAALMERVKGEGIE